MHRWLCFLLLISNVNTVFSQNYPQGYFRHPLKIPMQLVANFGEIRANHWHMGLDIRTQQKVNVPVYASAEGYVARISIEPGGFGQAIYINHPNGYTTLYAHMNSFYPELAKYIKEEQYKKQSWKIDIRLSPKQFPLNKDEFIGLSGSTGASAGPHVHYEIRDTKTENVLNPLLFKFPIADAVPPSIWRLAMYDRNKSTYAQSPQMLNIQKIRNGILKVGSDKISFAIGATDRFSGSNNPNGIYAAKIWMDGEAISSFTLDNIGYDNTRYMNAQVDYPFQAKGGAAVQHITPLPGATTIAYDTFGSDGIIYLEDGDPHIIRIEVLDAYKNKSTIEFKVQLDESLRPSYSSQEGGKWIPNHINIFERPDFEIFSSEATMYDTATVSYSAASVSTSNAISLQHNFLNATIPSHDYMTVRLKPSVPLSALQRERVVIKNISGSKTFVQKGTWQNGWFSAKFRQFGSYQAFVDNEPPTINSINSDLSKARSIVFTPRDNFNSIKNFRVELNGEWLRFTNDKGRTWVYTFDEHFPAGNHQLRVIVEDEAGNVTEKLWNVKR